MVESMAAEFFLDEAYLTDISIHKTWNTYAQKENPTQDDLIAMLQGKGWCSSLSSDDHPEFAKLRNQLGELGFIKIERGWWNGDRVTKTFTLNGYIFKKGEKFPSGAAIKLHMKYLKRKKVKNGS